jgi:two-component system sensor histidine kinase DesK
MLGVIIEWNRNPGAKKEPAQHTMRNAQMSNLDETGEVRTTEQISPYVLWPIWLIWLFFAIPSVVTFIQAKPPLPAMVTMMGGLTMFFAIYIWGSFQNAKQLVALTPVAPTLTWLWAPATALTLLSFALTLLGSGYGTDWTSLFYYTSGFVAGRLATRQAVTAIGALMLVAALAAWLAGLGPFDILRAVAFVAVIGIVTNGMVRALITSQQLRRAQEEIAHLAVANERLRIARDLHDLLGHNLSLIALKSELAGRLVKVAPERAAAEIADIESVARTTLQEVREAVASYRQPTLSSELYAATELLAAAGVAYSYEGDSATAISLSPAVENALAWTVREGVTNVVRHSRASHCTIRLTHDNGSVNIEVLDDGVGSKVPIQAKSASSSNLNGHNGGAGNGLRGLDERVEALGGQFEAGPRKEGGYRLAVSVPTTDEGAKMMDDRRPMEN